MRLEYAYITPLEVIPMKTRAEIYGNEAAALLRIVTMYPGLNMQQLLCFHPDKEEIKYEISDFLYHVMVLMVERGVTWEEITTELARR